ncbi:hypothetical protein REPUB_Repub07fG0015100 [Reevesia pubescens]
MKSYNPGWLLLVGILVSLSLPYSQAFWGNENKIKTAVILSPKFVLGPGSVENRVYYNVDFPKGHIALKSFNGEVVDEAGNPVPLHETYLHHWVVEKYYVRKEVGNPAEIPSGFEERWVLNVHAIDTRGVEDKLGCTECQCDLYKVKEDEYGRPLRPDYKGGLLCCYDRMQCRLKQGFEGVRRTLYLRYTVKWVDMDSFVVPVKIYLFDITDNWKRWNMKLNLAMPLDWLTMGALTPKG